MERPGKQRRRPAADRREQILALAEEEFARHGLHGVSAETIARRAGITHAYVFRLFGTKKNLFLEVAARAFDRMTESLLEAAGSATGLDALALMGRRYYERLADETMLLLQLQSFAACGDTEVRDAVRESYGRMWQAVATVTGLEAVQVKAFMAFGMLLSTGAALDLAHLDTDWSRQARTLIHPGLFTHITTEHNR